MVIFMVDFESAFKKPFTNMQKLIIGILLSIIPIVNWFARGFAMECSGVGKNKSSNKMPEWKDWSDYFIKGFSAVIISLIYALPALLVFLLGAGSLLGSIFRMALNNVLPFAMAGRGNAIVEGFTTGNFMEILPGLIKFAPFLLASLLVGLLAAYLIPMATLFYLRKNDISDAFQFKKVFKKAFTSDYFIAWLVVAFVGAIGSVILSIIPLIGGAAASFIISIISFTLFGEIYLKIRK